MTIRLSLHASNLAKEAWQEKVPNFVKSPVSEKVTQIMEEGCFSLKTNFFFGSCSETLIQMLPKGYVVVIISDRVVASLYAEALISAIQKFQKVLYFEIPCGEKGKTIAVKNRVDEFLFKNHCDRETVLIGLGGGSVCDLVGFVAATYYRGIHHIFIPTTLLAMVDAAIGGKNGVNTPYGKNLLGTVYCPMAVCVDLQVLKSLPRKTLLDGFSEVFKSALLYDNNFFKYICSVTDFFDDNVLFYCIKKSIFIKTVFVTSKKKYRDVLNFGHTFAHAFEWCSKYTLSHGKAVWLGIVLEVFLSYDHGFLCSNEFETIISSIRSKVCFIKYPLFSPKELYRSMSYEKKTEQHRPYSIALPSIGGYKNHPSIEKIFLTENYIEKVFLWSQSVSLL